jgi:hypothetical protein
MERPSAQNFEQERDVAKVERFLADAAARQRATGVPVGDDGRIDMTLYRGFYPSADIEQDLQRNREWEAEWSGGRPEEEMRKERRLREGNQLEMLACAIFGKNLGEQFIVVRTSPHDDRAHKADVAILDRTTGSLVCAFDEVGDASGEKYEKKQTLVRDKNLTGGVSLKYGIGVHAEQGKEKIVPSAAEHLPLFYIAVPSDRIRKGMEEFIADPIRQSEFEERLFSYFLATISAQIGALELYQARLDPELKKKLGAFKDVVGSFNAKQTKGKPARLKNK